MRGEELAPDPHSRIVNDICADLADEEDAAFTISRVQQRLQDRAKVEPHDLTLRALADACAYYSVDENNKSPGACGCFAPMAMLPQDDGGLSVYPTPLDRVEDGILDIWGTCARDEALHPLVRSRLADLLWTRRHDRRRQWFRVAVESYVELATTDVEVVEREGGLRRAVTICRESNHESLVGGPLDALRQVARRSLDTAEDQYGVVGRALETLVANGQPCSDLIEDAMAKYGGTPERAAGLCQIAIDASQDEEEKTSLRLQQIRAFTDAAAPSSGLKRLSHLEDARSIAREAGLAHEEREIALMEEQTDLDDVWQTSEISSEVDGEEVSSYVNAVVGDDDLSAALQRFGWSIPIGDPEESKAFLAEIAREHPLQFLMQLISVGPDNSVTRIPSGHPMRDDVELGRYDAQAIDFFAKLHGRFALEAIDERYGPDRQMLSECFTCVAIPAGLANRVAVSHGHWKARDFVSAVSVLVLTLEGVVRRICHQAGINTTETARPRGGDIPMGQVRPLAPLIADLGATFGATPTRYLEAALVDRWSLNLRNSLAHVLAEEMTEGQYVVLFHIACMLRLMSNALTRAGA